MQAEPIESWDGDNPIPGTPYWVSLEDITENDVLPNDFWEAVVEAIDAKCKLEQRLLNPGRHSKHTRRKWALGRLVRFFGTADPLPAHRQCRFLDLGVNLACLALAAARRSASSSNVRPSSTNSAGSRARTTLCSSTPT
jgi:hypothetical protein